MSVRDALPELRGQGYYEDFSIRSIARASPMRDRRCRSICRQHPTIRSNENMPIWFYQPMTENPTAGVVGVFVGVPMSPTASRPRRGCGYRAPESSDHGRHIDYAILALDLDGIILRWNEGARRIFGWTEEEVAGKHWQLLFHA